VGADADADADAGVSGETSHTVRASMSAALLLWCLALIVFALAPLSEESPEIEFNEWAVAGLAGLAVVGLIGRMLRRVVFPGDAWTYLLVGASGIYVLLVWNIQIQSVPFWTKTMINLFVLSGVLGGYSAHLADGGRKRHAR
jgi:hypothetical protein